MSSASFGIPSSAVGTNRNVPGPVGTRATVRPGASTAGSTASCSTSCFHSACRRRCPRPPRPASATRSYALLPESSAASVVRFVRSDARLAKVRVLFGLLFRRLERSPLLIRTITPAVRLRFDRRRVSVALDGEIVQVDGDVQIHTDPGQLLVFVGEGAVKS